LSVRFGHIRARPTVLAMQEGLDEFLHHRHRTHGKVPVVDLETAQSVLDLAHQHKDEIPIFIVLGLEPTKPHSLIDVALAAGSKRFLAHKYAQAYLERVWSDQRALAAAERREKKFDSGAYQDNKRRGSHADTAEAGDEERTKDGHVAVPSKVAGGDIRISGKALKLLGSVPTLASVRGLKRETAGMVSIPFRLASKVMQLVRLLRGFGWSPPQGNASLTVTPKLEFLFHCIVYSAFLFCSVILLLTFPNVSDFERDPYNPMILMYIFYGMMHVLAELFQYFRGDSFWSYFYDNIPDFIMSAFFCASFALYPLAVIQLEASKGGYLDSSGIASRIVLGEDGDRLPHTLTRFHWVVASMMIVSFWRFLDMVRMFNRSLGVLMIITQRVITRDLGSWMLLAVMVAVGFELHFTTYRYDANDDRPLLAACFGTGHTNTLFGNFENENEEYEQGEEPNMCSFGMILWTVVGGAPEWNLPGSPTSLQGVEGTMNRFMAMVVVMAYLLLVTIILLNLLIAMMATTYEQVERESDFEYKFVRVTLIKEYTCMGIYYAPFTLLELADIFGMFWKAWATPTWQWQNHENLDEKKTHISLTGLHHTMAAFIKAQTAIQAQGALQDPTDTGKHTCSHWWRRLTRPVARAYTTLKRHSRAHYYGDTGATQAVVFATMIAFFACGCTQWTFAAIVFGDSVGGDWSGVDAADSALHGIQVAPGRDGRGYSAFFSTDRWPSSTYGHGTDGQANWELRILLARWLPVLTQIIVSLFTLRRTKTVLPRGVLRNASTTSAVPMAFINGGMLGIVYTAVVQLHFTQSDYSCELLRTLAMGATVGAHFFAWAARLSGWLKYDEEVHRFGWEDFAAHLNSSIEQQYLRLKGAGKIKRKSFTSEVPLRLLEFQHPYSLHKHAIEYKSHPISSSIGAHLSRHSQYYQLNTRTGNTRKVKRVPGYECSIASMKHAAMVAYRRSRLRGRNANWGMLLTSAENNALLQRFQMQKREIGGAHKAEHGNMSRRRQRAETFKAARTSNG
jgi:hypothetical protein